MQTISSKKLQAWAPLFFIAFSITLRFFSFFPSVIDHDESTYAVMGMEMLRGELLYADIIDLKPVGIYLIYAAITALSKSVFFIRLVAAIVVGLSAYQLFLIKSKFTENIHLKLLTGFTYIILLSLDPIFKTQPFGLPGNTEIYFCFFTLTSINLLLKPNLQLGRSFLAGLIVGLGFIIKYLVIVEVAGIFVFLIVLAFLNKESLAAQLKKIISNGIIYLIGLFIPLLCSHLYFAWIEAYSAIEYITFEAPLRYRSYSNIMDQFSFIMGSHQLFLTMLLFYGAILSPYHLHDPKKREKLFILIWLLFSVIAMVSSGKQYNHYRIQSFAALAFCIPNLVCYAKWIGDRVSEKKRLLLAYSYILANLVFYSIHYHQKYVAPIDQEQLMANYINNKKQAGDLLANRQHGKQVVNYLTGLSNPSHVIHTNNLGDSIREYVFNIDRAKECAFIYTQKPRFVIGDDLLCQAFDSTYSSSYELDTLIGDMTLYELKKE